MRKKKLGLNKYQKAAYKRGEVRVSSQDVKVLIELSESQDPEDRLTAARYLCPCHVRRRVEAAWEALYRMLEDSDVKVRRAAWHTLEDGGRPDDPKLDAIFNRALQTETDPQVRGFVELFSAPKKRKAEMALKLAGVSEFKERGKCDFCGESNLYLKMDFETEINVGGETRFALICQSCDRLSEA